MARIKVNGETRTIDVDENTPLLWVIREQLGLTGTKYGCGIAACGSCTIHIDGAPIRACVYPVGAVTEEEEITTIEGLSDTASHPVQEAWAELDIPQCGYCQPGMIMAVAGMLNDTPNPTDEDIDAQITNICRCGTLARVRKGIRLAVDKS